MNKLLSRQFKKYLGQAKAFPPGFDQFIAAISESYDHFERDRKMIERSIEISSNEMIGLNIELRKEKEELRIIQEELNFLFNSINECLFSIDMHSHQLLRISAPCEKIYGYSPSDFLANPELWSEVIYPDDQRMVNKDLRDLYEGKPVRNQYRIVRKDNTVRWVENRIIPTINSAGELIRIDGVINDITDRKQIELDLERSVSVLEATLESTTDALLVVDLNGKVLKYNNRFLELWGIPRAVLENLDDQKSINYVLNQLPDPVSFEEKIKELYANKDQISFDILKLKDGRTVERYSQPQLINDRYVGRVWSFRDITKQLADEDNIRKSEETRSLIMKAAMDAIICIDLSGNIIFWNQQAEEIFGWKSDEVMNKQLADFIIPDHYQKSHHEGMAHFKKTGEGAILNKLTELSAIRRNGDEFPIELTVTEIMQDNEQFFCAFIRDITQRKKAEIALQKSNERFNLAAKATSDIIWDWNLITGKVIRSEENMVKLLGYAKQVTQDPGFNWMDLIHADDIARINEKFDKCLNDPTIFYMDDEYRFQKASGEYAYLYDKGYIIRDGNGKATRMIGSTQDITRIKENELQLKKRADELAISNLELEQFAFITSHDLQEPLRMITGFLTQLDRKYNHLLDDKARKYIFYAVDGARRMRQIILDLLEYSRVGRGDDKMEDIDLNELMHEIQILLQKKIIQKNAKVHIADLPVIKSYRGPLRQVFQNLISNALKYNRENVNSNISIAVNEVNNEWQFSITDNGIGIEEEYFEKIFVLFQRLHDKTEYSGTGVGLAVTKKIVESLGGKIWVESKPDEGSTFYFTIPQKSF